MNNSTTTSVTLESLRATIAAIPPPPEPGVGVYRGKAADLLRGLKEAGVFPEPWHPPGMLGGLVVEEIPSLGVTLVGPAGDVYAAMESPATLGRIRSMAGG